MALKFKWFVLLIALDSVATFGQIYESLERGATNYFISLTENDSDSYEKFGKLREVLYSEIDINELEKIYRISKYELDNLINHFNEFELTLNNISSDSALVLFNQWYLHFCNAFHNYANEKFFSSNKTKILFFSTSMSCQCTLDMCRKQTIEILNFAKGKNSDYWVVDSYEHNALQIKYETFFAPSLVLFDGNNKVLYKIEYDENLLSKLGEFINTKLKG